MSENDDLTPPRLVQDHMEDALQGKGFNGQPERFIKTEDGALVIENPGVRWHLLTLRRAIKLEGIGLRHSSGRSALKHAKDVYGFKGNRETVLSQIDARLEELRQQALEEKF